MKVLLIRLSVVGLIALLALGVAGCVPKSPQGDSLVQVGPALSTNTASTNSQVEGLDDQTGADTQVSGATGPVKAQVTPQLDGSSLLQIYCAKCHSVSLLEKTKKTRVDWEKILSRMERTKVRLSSTERYTLLDYLAAPVKP